MEAGYIDPLFCFIITSGHMLCILLKSYFMCINAIKDLRFFTSDIDSLFISLKEGLKNVYPMQD